MRLIVCRCMQVKEMQTLLKPDGAKVNYSIRLNYCFQFPCLVCNIPPYSIEKPIFARKYHFLRCLLIKKFDFESLRLNQDLIT